MSIELRDGSGSNTSMIVSFQGLRGYGILLIFLSHCDISFGGKDEIFNHLGAIGVCAFIMLSGYLAVYKAENNADSFRLADSYKHKLKKFYPLHLLTLLLAIPFNRNALFMFPSLIEYGKLGANILLVQAWMPWQTVYFSYNAVSWYLSLTMFFVLAAPMIVKLIRKCSFCFLRASMAGVIFLIIIWCKLWQMNRFAHWLIYILPPIRCFDFFIGGGCYILAKELSKKDTKGKCCELLCALAIATLAVGFILSAGVKNEFFSVCAWICPVAIIIISIAVGDSRSKLFACLFKNKIILYLGSFSFELFLWHQLIIRYLTAISNKINVEIGAWIYLIAFAISISTSVVYHEILNKKKTWKEGKIYDNAK